MINRERISFSGAQTRFLCYSTIFSAIIAFVSLFFYPQLLPTKIFADGTIDVTPSLSISPASPLTLTVAPGTFNSANETISVSTTNYTGYTLNLQTSGSTTDLVHTGNPSLVIPTIATMDSFSTAGYGYSFDNSQYKPVPSISSQGDNLVVTSHENPGTGSHTLAFGAKSNTTTPSGTYQNTFTLTATANDSTYSIIYNANAGSDTVTNMPSANESSISANVVTISSKTPVRLNYEFLGWAESPSATQASIQPSGTFTIDPTGANSKVYYAVWKFSKYMQNVAAWGNTLNTGDSTTAVDIRDGTTYTIARLDDGNIWMTQNLRLEFDNLDENISAQNTNNPTSDFMAWANNSPTADNTTWCYIDSDACVYEYKYDNSNIGDFTLDSHGDAYDDYGVYYKSLVFTAGNTNNFNSKGDICPYGWHLPGMTWDSANNTIVSQYAILNDAINSGSLSDPSGLNEDIAHFLYSGFKRETVLNRGTQFLYPQAFRRNEYYGSYYMSYYGTSINISGQYSDSARRSNTYGMTVRCIAGRQFSINYDATGGVFAYESQTVYDETASSRTLTIPNVIPTRAGYTFFGWATDKNATTAAYSAGETVTIQASNNIIDLFALWMPTNDKTMQSVTTWASSVSQGQSTTAIDTRDGSGYTVARLSDGRLWMTRNLRLDFSNLRQNISASNTNNPTASFATAINNGIQPNIGVWCMTYDAACIETINYSMVPIGDQKPDNFGALADDYGGYYNYYTASAGNAPFSIGTEIIAGDICPYGWRLATSNYSDSDYTNLNTIVNSGSTSDASVYLASPINMVFSGSRSATGRGGTGFSSAPPYTMYIWSGKTGTNGGTIWGGIFGIDRQESNVDSVLLNNILLRYIGAPIRCIAGQKYTLKYDANGGTNAPADQSVYSETSMSQTITVTSSTPTRTGYAFLGWSTNPNASTASIFSGDTVTAAFNDNIKTIYAVWQVNTNKTMQSVASWASSVTTGTSTTAIDTRDGSGYTVARLADGRLWMTKHLRLDPGTMSGTITASNTNNPTTAFMNWANANPASLPATSWCKTTDDTCEESFEHNATNIGNNTIDVNGDPYDSYGVYYNWYTATAGHGVRAVTDASTGQNNVSGDICPYGWRLPSGGTDGEYVIMNNEVNGGLTEDNTALLADPPHFVYSGFLNPTGGSVIGRGNDTYKNGYLWTSTFGRYDTPEMGIYAIDYAYEFNVNDSSQTTSRVTPNGQGPRKQGQAVRCIAGQTYKLVYDGNGGGHTPSNEAYYSETELTHAFTVSSSTPTRTGYTFLGWSTDKNATTASISASSTITTTFNDNIKTLYAVWSIPNNRTLQNVASWNTSLSNGDTGTAVDARDGKSYTVARLADGRLWMTKNLQLDFSNLSTSITAANTNNPTSAFMTWANNNPSSTNTGWCTDQTDSTCTDQFIYKNTRAGQSGTDAQGSNYDDYGVFYNPYTASAGHITSETANGSVAPGDICPYGWRLATGGSNSEYYYLNYYINNGSTTDPSNLGPGTTFNLPYSGYHYNSWFYNTGDSTSTPQSFVLGSNSWVQSSTSYLFTYYFGAQNNLSDSTASYVRYSYGVYRYNGYPIRCVADERKFTLYYSANGGSGAPGSSSTGNVFTDSNTFTVSSTVPTRSGFTFNGWYFEDAPGTLYHAGDTITVSASNSSKSISGGVRYYRYLYASWTPSQYMQNVSTWGSNVAVGQTTEAVDRRDGKVYTVGRLEDGNLWMKENLKLEISELQENISASNTNNPTSSFMTAANAKPNSTAATSWCATNDAACQDQLLYYYYGNYTASNNITYKVGTYMNFYTATAGNWTYGTINQNGVAGDICPYGWKLPVGRQDWNPYKLYNDLVNSGSTTDSTGLLNSQAEFQLTGYLSAGAQIYNITYSGQHWTRSGYTGGGWTMYYRPDANTVVPANTTSYYYGYNGYTVRCIAKEYANVTINYGPAGNLDGIDVDGNDVPDGSTIALETGEQHTIALGALAGGNFVSWGLNVSGTPAGAGTAYNSYNTNAATMTFIPNKKMNITIWPNIEETNGFEQAYAVAGKTKYNGYYKMQDMDWNSICVNVDSGESTSLIDTRDNQIYRVLATNSNCWMTDNLNLGAATFQVSQFDSTNTDMQSGSTLSTSTFSSWIRSSLAADYSSGQIMTLNNSSTDSYGSRYGTLYNYYAASLGSVWGASSTSMPTQTVCPKGWSLPYKQQFDELKSEYGLTSTTIQQSPLYFPLAGYGYTGSSRNDVGSFGRWWGGGNKTNSTTSMDHMYATVYGTLTAEVGDRRMSNAVRCVAGWGNG